MKRISQLVLLSIMLFLFFLSGPAFGQSEVLGMVEYLDDPLEARIVLADGSETDAFIGLELAGGTIIQTFMTTAEIRLTTGSLLRLSENTVFRLEAERVSGEERVSTFTLAAGTLRCVAARATGQGYAVHTPSAAMGVRGTDFIVEVFEGAETLSVLEGVVESLHKASGRSSLVKSGFFRNLTDENAEPRALTEELLEQLKRKNSFQVLDPAQVVHQSAEAGAVDLTRETGGVDEDERKSFWEMAFSSRDGSSAGSPRDKETVKAPRKERAAGEGDVSFVLAAGLHPELVQIAQSTWTQLLGMGVGGSVSLTAGFLKTPGFFGGLTGGFTYLSGKSTGSLDSSLWVPLGFVAGIRSSLAPPLSFFAAGEGGAQFTRMTYSIDGLAPIEGWAPYVQARLGVRYDLSPLVLEAGAGFGVVIDAEPIPFIRVILGVVYEVKL